MFARLGNVDVDSAMMIMMVTDSRIIVNDFIREFENFNRQNWR